MGPNPQHPADLVTYTEEILHGKLSFCAVSVIQFQSDIFKFSLIMECYISIASIVCFIYVKLTSTYVITIAIFGSW